jgi:lipid A ethanolaminephosphotransferase
MGASRHEPGPPGGKKPVMTQQRLVLLTALYIVMFCNGAFFKHVLAVYPLSLKSAGFLISLAIVLLSLHLFLFTLAGSRWTTKPP